MAGERLALLASALNQDMKGVQSRTLTSLTNADLSFSAPYDIADVFGRTFSRYPYPESFFIWRNSSNGEESAHIFNRSDRLPAWLTQRRSPGRVPVDIIDGLFQLEPLVREIQSHATSGRSFTMVNASLSGVPYQVIARLLYRDGRDDLLGIVGFTINTEWVRRHYFRDITYQVGLVGGPADKLSLGVIDDRGHFVTSLDSATTLAEQSIRFPFLFMDSALLDDATPTFPLWTARVTIPQDADHADELRPRLGILSLAALSLATLFLTIRTVRLNARLAAMKFEFVAAVTHELKTPLAGIGLVAEMLTQRRYSSEKIINEYASLLTQESARLGRLIDNLLTFARMSDVTTFYNFKRISICDVVSDAIDKAQIRLDRLGFHVSIDTSPPIPLVMADRSALAQALDNLIDNAIKYSEHIKEISLRVWMEQNEVILEISDHGRGIPADEHERVFDKFYRGRTSQQGGNGLGLTIVARIIADHGGRAWLNSRADQGTSVYIALPSAETYDGRPHSNR